MIKMQRLNVVKYACSEEKAKDLEAKGFRRCAQKQPQEKESPQQEGDSGQETAGSGNGKPTAGKNGKNGKS